MPTSSSPSGILPEVVFKFIGLALSGRNRRGNLAGLTATTPSKPTGRLRGPAGRRSSRGGNGSRTCGGPESATGRRGSDRGGLHGPALGHGVDVGAQVVIGLIGIVKEGLQVQRLVTAVAISSKGGRAEGVQQLLRDGGRTAVSTILPKAVDLRTWLVTAGELIRPPLGGLPALPAALLEVGFASPASSLPSSEISMVVLAPFFFEAMVERAWTGRDVGSDSAAPLSLESPTTAVNFGGPLPGH